MKIRVLMVLCLCTVFVFAACGGDETNTNVTNANAVNTNVAAKTPESAKSDPVMQKKIEDALKAKGFNNVTVDTTTTPATLRGTVPAGKLPEAYQTAQEAAGKPLVNQMSEEK